MTSLGSQSAPLPRRGITECAAAYAAGNAELGDWLFPYAAQQIEQPIRRIIERITDDRDGIDDIAQEVITKLWATLRSGIEPNFKLVTYHTTIHLYRTRSGMGDAGRAGRERNGQRIDMVPIDTMHAPSEDNTDKIIGALDDDALLTELGRQNPMWALVAQYRIDGLSQNQIATNLDTSRSEIRKLLDEIRDYLEQRAA